MSTTPMLVTDTIGDAGRMLVTPYTEEMEVRRWLYAAYGSPPWLRANHGEETAAGMIEAIEAVVDKAVNDRAAAFAENYRVILEWTRGERIRNDWLHPDTVFIIEDWTVYVWKVVEAGHDKKDIESYVEPPEWLADLSDGFKVDPEDENPINTTDSEPYEEAEERLLAKAGLPSSIVLRVDGP